MDAIKRDPGDGQQPFATVERVLYDFLAEKVLEGFRNSELCEELENIYVDEKETYGSIYRRLLSCKIKSSPPFAWALHLIGFFALVM